MSWFFRKSRRFMFAAAVLVLVTSGPQFSAFGERKAPSLSALARQQRDNLNNIRRKRNKAQSALIKKQREEKTVTGQLANTEAMLEATQIKVIKAELQLQRVEEQLRITTVRLLRTQAQLTRRQDLLSARVVDIYEGESLSYLNVLLGSTDMWTFLTRTHDIQQIVRSDVDLIGRIKKDKERIEADRARQQAQVDAAASLQEGLVAERDKRQKLVNDKQRQLSRIESDVDTLQRALDELDRQSEAITASIRARQQTPSGRARMARTFRGGILMPVSGRITSDYGYRVHPILRQVRMHTGVDIAAPSGTSIYAAADGEVATAGWNGAYGKCITIDHDGGVTTLYGHCSSISVKSGQQVKKGQVIGRVGSTGWSTGPHLHFEKRVNGKPVRPF